MRTAVALIALVASCSFDWARYEPGGGAGGAMGGTNSGAGAGAPDGGAAGEAGQGGGACADGTLCDGMCVDVDGDPEHCGDCTTTCAPAQLCTASACRDAPSCKALHAARPALGDGSYSLDAGSGAFVAHCDMTIDGGGWTLVASVADQSYFADTTCSTPCSPNPAVGSCDETPFTDAAVVGDVADMLIADHKSAAYSAVPFDEMLFVDANGHFASYAVSGPNVRDWYPAGLENWVGADIEAHPTHSFPVNVSDLAPTINSCSTLRVSFNVEDSDGAIGATCHESIRGPAWAAVGNDTCFWDDGGVPWTSGAFYANNPSSYRLWLVR